MPVAAAKAPRTFVDVAQPHVGPPSASMPKRLTEPLWPQQKHAPPRMYCGGMSSEQERSTPCRAQRPRAEHLNLIAKRGKR